MEIKELLELVAKENASDLLITAGAPPMLRVNGQLFRTRYDSLTPEKAKDLVYSFLQTEQRKQFEQNKELDFSLALGRKHRFRVNVYLQKGRGHTNREPETVDMRLATSQIATPLCEDTRLGTEGTHST